jgi:hypothetical protein
MHFSERIPIVKRRMTVTSLQSHLTHNPPDGDSVFFQHNAWHFHMVKNNCVAAITVVVVVVMTAV